MKIQILCLSVLIAWGISLQARAQVSASPSNADSNEEQLYNDGTRAINDARWGEAQAAFEKVAQQQGRRADAALYWKAYAQNKGGQVAQASTTCEELGRKYPNSRWLNECSALEIEIRSKTGQPAAIVEPEQGVSTANAENDDLKLLALNALMQRDEARALPIIQQMLNNSRSEKIRERALFVLAQSQSKAAQDTLLQIARAQNNPELQTKAIQMMAALQGARSNAALLDIYQHSSDPHVKKAVLQAYVITGDSTKLADAAEHESNPDLVRTAIHSIGATGDVAQLTRLYQSKNDRRIRSEILDGLVSSGERGAEALSALAKSEQDTELRRKAVRNLGVAGGTSAAPALVEIYQKTPEPDIRKAAIEGLFIAGDAHDLVQLARAEKDPSMRKVLVERLSVMEDKEATAYMVELLNK